MRRKGEQEGKGRGEGWGWSWGWCWCWGWSWSREGLGWRRGRIGQARLVDDDFAEDEFEDGVTNALENEFDVLR